MKVAVFVAALAFVGQTSQTKLYEHTPSNLKFSLSGPSKITKKKGDWTITFPAGSGQATLRIFAISFTAAPDVWEGTQKYFAEQQKMILLGLNQEEILGVPLLLAKMQETATLDRNITMSGIIYAATDWKLSFRLTAPETVFEAAEAKWRDSLLTLGTIDGRTPAPEKPGRATEASAGNKKAPDVPDFTRTPIGQTGLDKPAAVIGEVKFEGTAAGRALELCVPSGFTLSKAEGGIGVEHPASAWRAVVRLASSLDSGSMASAITNTAAKGLGEFTIVKKRDETLPFENAAGSRTIRVFREGESSKGYLFSAIAGGEKGNFFWILEWTSTSKPTESQFQALARFIQTASVEPKP